MPFARTHGAGFRGLYDLSDPEKSRFMITTGESGHIFSRHYGDFVPLWNDVDRSRSPARRRTSNRLAPKS